MKEIARQCINSLSHDKGNHYIILVDQNFEEDIWADNSTDAISQFRDWCKQVS